MTDKELRNIPLNSSTNEKYTLDILNKLDNTPQDSVSGRKWRRYLQVLTQMIGLISVKGNDDFENRQNLFFECCYSTGSVVLTFFNQRLQIWTVAGEVKQDINGDIEYIDCQPYVGISNQTNVKIETTRITGPNLVYVKSAPYGLNLWILWNQILEDNAELMEIYLTNSKLNIKKLLYIVNNDSKDIVEQEINSIFNYSNPVIKSLNPITNASKDIRSASGEQNLFEPLNLGTINYSFDDVMNHWIFETNLMGLYADEYHKKERNTTGENEMSQANTVIIHEVILREWKKAEKEINEKFKLNIEFFKTFELSVAANNENETNGGNDETK